MNIKALLSQRIESAFEALGLEGQAMLQAASRPEFGDYQANGVMAAAKRSRQNPKKSGRSGHSSSRSKRHRQRCQHRWTWLYQHYFS
jgi:arginyl-tRNA synthetase